MKEAGEIDLKETVIQMGDLKIGLYPTIITCIGLGSCVGFYLYDSILKIGGGAHIMLPSIKKRVDLNIGPNYYADSACLALLNGMLHYQSKLLNIKAKLVGGANVLGEHSLGMGNKNVKAVKRELIRLNVIIESEDLEGTSTRTTRFNSETGELSISNGLGKKYSI
jgi:chemotaxis protein CheD